ncbi:MAG TPA: YceI family protein [Asticcacaulis sp.]|nr:YceI family protein [Asticcacaulis sp.]
MKMFAKPLMAATVAFALAMSVPACAAPVTYKIDPRHTFVMFTYSHAGGLAHMNGKFMSAAGAVTLDEAAPANSSVEVAFPIDAINTGLAELDTELKKPGYFDAAAYPTATFKSTRVDVTGKDTAKVTGDLTIRGITRPVVLDVKLNKISDDKSRAGFSATASVKRSDFGITKVPLVGDQVDLTIEAETAVPPPAK